MNIVWIGMLGIVVETSDLDVDACAIIQQQSETENAGKHLRQRTLHRL